MRQYIISKCFVTTTVFAVVVILCLSWTSRDGVAQPNDAIGDDVLTVEQCINDNTDASIKPVEKKILIEESIIEEQLSNTTITNEVCREIVARTPHGSPVERIIAAGNVTQAIDVIQKSMKEAVEGDVNGDGVVNEKDTRVASAASYAASHTAQKTVRTAINEEVSQIGVIEEINSVPVVYFQDPGQNQYSGPPSPPPSPPPPAPPPPSGGDGGDAGDGLFENLPSQEEVQANARSAAQDKGASSKAAVAGGDCAAPVALADGTYLDIFKGNIAFEEPAKEMQWKERDVAELAMSPSGLESIEELKQQLEEAEQPNEIIGQCLPLAEEMQAKFISNGSALTITPFGSDIQDIALSEGTGWKWEIVASNEGTHHLTLFIEMRSAEGDKARAVMPSPFDDDITVRATLWQKSASFARGNWQFFLAPFLAPIAYYLWRKYKQRSNDHEEGGYI
jgi:hypothetical protein